MLLTLDLTSVCHCGLSCVLLGLAEPLISIQLMPVTSCHCHIVKHLLMEKRHPCLRITAIQGEEVLETGQATYSSIVTSAPVMMTVKAWLVCWMRPPPHWPWTSLKFLLLHVFYPETECRYVVQASLELPGLLPQLPQCWSSKHTSSYRTSYYNVLKNTLTLRISSVWKA